MPDYDNAKLVEYDENYNVVMSNEIIRGQQFSTKNEARFIRLVVAQIDQCDTALWTYQTTVDAFAKFFGIKKNNIYRDIQDMCVALLGRHVLIESGNKKQPWDAINWFEKVEFRDGRITFIMSQSIKPYVIGLKHFFTQCKLKYFVHLQTVYGIRLYELIQCERNEKKSNRITFTAQYMRDILLSARNKDGKKDKRYPRFSSFKKSVIDKAVEDINANTDLKIINVIGETYGKRNVVDVVFEVETQTCAKVEVKRAKAKKKSCDDLDNLLTLPGQTFKPEKVIKNKTESSMVQNEGIDALSFLESVSEQEKYKLLEVANNDIDIIKAKYELACKQRQIRNLTAWLISAIKMDFQAIKVQNNSFIDNCMQRDYTQEELLKHEQLVLACEYVGKPRR